MKTQKEVNLALNEALAQELVGINQHFLHARMLRNWGYDKLADFDYKLSIEAMKQADKIVQRIFLLEGLPNLQNLGKLLIGESVPEILACDAKTQETLRNALAKAIALVEEKEDFVSRDTLEDILKSCEETIDKLEEQKRLCDDLGLEKYHQSIA